MWARACWLLSVLPVLVCASNAEVAQFHAAEKGGQIRLTSSSYDRLLSSPRNYSVSVLLTAMAPQFGCGPCAQFAPEHAAVAQAWKSTKDKQGNEHFFAVLDFMEGREVFAKLGLQNAPVLQYHAPTEGPRKGSPGPEGYDFSKGGFRAEPFAHFLNTRGLHFTFKRPLDMTKVGLTVFVLGSIVVGCIFFWPAIHAVIGHKYLWAAVVLPAILLMTSGYMWNQIRRPPYVQASRQGPVNYIAPGYSNQLGVETHIVSVIYGVLGFSAYTLAYTIPKLRDPLRQRVGVYVWTGIFVVVAGILTNLFGIKQGGYPFRIF